MNKVRIGMYWQVYGTQIVNLPDDIDIGDHDAVVNWVCENFDDIPLPDGDYVYGSDGFDEESIEAYKDDVNG